MSAPYFAARFYLLAQYPCKIFRKKPILMSECMEDMWLAENGSNIYFGEYKAK